jgi:acyl carrier protein
MDARIEIRKFLLSRFLPGEPAAALKDNASFLERGIIDSTGVLELVAFIENTFALKLEDDELIPDNLDSVDHLVEFIARKTGHAAKPLSGR